MKIATGGRGYVGCETAATEKAAASGEKQGQGEKKKEPAVASSSRFIVIKRWVHTVSNAHRQLLLLLLLESVFNLAHTAKGDCRRASHLND